MNEAFGLTGGVYAGASFNFDKEEEFFVEDAWELINDHTPASTEVKTTFFLNGVE